MRSGICLYLFPLILMACSGNEQRDKVNTETPADTTARLAKNFLRDCRKLYSDARKWDSILMTQHEEDLSTANTAIRAFTDFAYYCHNDSLAPVYLIKTAQVARAVNNIPQAKVVLDRCVDSYPSSKHRPAAMFLLAQLYDETVYLNNEEEAERLYKAIISEYPGNDWAISAKGALQFIGKSDTEIIRELEKKNSRSGK